MAAITDNYDREKNQHDHHTNIHQNRTRHVPNAFQQLDYVPIISIVTAIVRAIFGLIQIGVGCITFIPECLYDLTQEKNHQTLLVKGWLNVGRACYVWIPGLGNYIAYSRDRDITAH